MGQWDENQQAPIVTETPTRVKWFIMLAETQEQIESAYIMDQIDRDEFERQLRDLDGKLAIVGLTLITKPWVKNATRL